MVMKVSTFCKRATSKTVLDKFRMGNARSVLIPMDELPAKPGISPTVSPDSEEAGASTFRSIMGSLMYAAVGTRPDLSFTVTYLSQFLKSLTSDHLNGCSNTLRATTN